ncbi:MAG: SufE family protein [Anaerolineae bacterium]|nr:SufE family protein [Anaerolineae bacterium]
MADLPQALKNILQDFEMLPDMDRQMYLIDYSDHFKEVPPEVATRPFPETHHVKECESDAYVWAAPRGDGTFDFHFAVENPQGVSARSFSRILQETLSGQPVDVINAVPDTLVTDLFGKGISMGKGMGLQGILRMVKYFANATKG